jgi:hypothetical protein
MNCLFRDQHNVGFGRLLRERITDARGRVAKASGTGVSRVAMPAGATLYRTPHTTQVHKGRSISSR